MLAITQGGTRRNLALTEEIVKVEEEIDVRVAACMGSDRSISGSAPLRAKLR